MVVILFGAVWIGFCAFLAPRLIDIALVEYLAKRGYMLNAKVLELLKSLLFSLWLFVWVIF